MGIRRIACTLVGVVLLAGCGAAPAPVAPSASSGPSVAGADDGPRFERAPDADVLHGDAVFAPDLVAVPGGGFLMVMNEDMPNGGTLLRSEDGRTWTPIDVADRVAAGLGAAAITDIAATGSTILLTGTDKPFDPEAPRRLPAAWTTAEGTTWTRLAELGVLQATGSWSVTGSPVGFAATNDERLEVLIAGPDATAWRRTEVPVPAGLRASVGQVAPLDDGFIALGVIEGEAVAWRWNGAGWRRLILGLGGDPSAVSASGSRLVITGYHEEADPAKPADDGATIMRAVAWESADGGGTWVTSPLPIGERSDVEVLSAGGGRFVAVVGPSDASGGTAAFWSTEPGIWTEIPFDDPSADDWVLISRIAISGGRVVLAGSTVGTGAGGDRIGVWTADLAGS